MCVNEEFSGHRFSITKDLPLEDQQEYKGETLQFWYCDINDLYIGGSRGGVPGARPLWDPILSFLHTFTPKSAHVRGPCPPNGCMPPPPPHEKSWISHCYIYYQEINNIKI